MNWPAQCAGVIPCLNEATAIGPLVQAVRRHLPTVFVVDDGSCDRTAEEAERRGAQVLRHPAPSGKGTALQTGWRHAREQGFAWALALDGDGQHSPDDIPAFFDCAERTAAELVVGNRMTGGTQMPRVRRFVNRWMSRRLSLAAGRSLPDSQCGFRLMNLAAWSGLRLTTRHFEMESELLLAFAVANCAMEFIPIRVIYKMGQSKIHPVRDTLRWFRWWRTRPRFPNESKNRRPRMDLGYQGASSKNTI